MLAIDTINANHQSVGHGLRVRNLRNQSLLPTEKQRARLSLSAFFQHSDVTFNNNDV